MNKIILIITVLIVFTTISCKNNAKQKNAEATKTEIVETDSSNIVAISKTDNEGNILDMVFDNNKDIVTLSYKGENAELTKQKAASGFWYANNNYELYGKGNDITLKKDDQVIFEYQDDIVNIEAKNDKGDILHMAFNNSTDKVKVCLNDGEEIEMTAERAASGIWYTNDHYELSGKGDKYELKKDGKTIFQN